MDRTKIEKGMFMTGGAPVAGAQLTKVHVIETAEDLEAADRHFDQMAKAIELTKKALEALRGKPS